MSGQDGPRQAAGAWELDLHGLADGRLDAGRARATERRAADDPALGEQLAAWRRQNQLFAELREGMSVLDSRDFQPGLQRSLAQALTRTRRMRRSGLRAMAAAAAAVAVLVTGLALVGERWAPPVVRQAELPPEFLFGKSFVVPASTASMGDGRESLDWLSQQLADERIRLGDLEEMGLRLAGGGVIETAKSPAIHLIFLDSDSQPVSLYVGLVSRQVRPAFAPVPEGHLALHWRQGRLVFALVGAIDSPRLLEIMDHVSIEVLAPNASPVLSPVLSPAVPGGSKDAAAHALSPAILPADAASAAGAAVIVAPTGPVAPVPVTPVSTAVTEPKAL